MAGSPTLYGGQAVIEGVMMRGSQQFAVACRRASGEIAVTCEPVPKVFRPAWQKLPFLRGAFSLVDAMTLGTKAMFWAAKIAESDIPKPEGKNKVRLSEEVVGPALGTAVAARDPLPADAPASSSSGVTDVAIGGAMVTGLLFALVLVFVIPNLVLSGVQALGVTKTWQLGLIDAAVRFGIFFTYIASISRMAHVRRVFQYHGAEHKAINALEAGGRAGLTVDAARAASRLHPRCGTSFVFIVLLISTIALAPFYGLHAYIRVPIHLLLALPIAGVSFELLRLAGKYRDRPLAAALSRPGMYAQLLTTREPDDEQLAVALASLKSVMDAERDNASPPISTEAEEPEVA